VDQSKEVERKKRKEADQVLKKIQRKKEVEKKAVR